MIKSLRQVIQGDCLKVLQGLPSECIDLVCTDSPYGVSQESHLHTMKNRKYRSGYYYGEWDTKEWVSSGVLDEIERVIKPAGAMVMFYDSLSMKDISIMNPRRLIFWKKTNPAPIWQNPFPVSTVECALYTTKSKTGTYNGHGDTNWFECPSPTPQERYHPNQKPLELMEWLISLFSNEGDIVLDPFLGSGTTALACEKLRRKWLGIEINEAYCEIARKRLEPWMNQSRLETLDVGKEGITFP